MSVCLCVCVSACLCLCVSVSVCVLYLYVVVLFCTLAACQRFTRDARLHMSPEPYPLNPKPQTPNPKPKTLNPKDSQARGLQRVHGRLRREDAESQDGPGAGPHMGLSTLNLLDVVQRTCYTLSPKP